MLLLMAIGLCRLAFFIKDVLRTKIFRKLVAYFFVVACCSHVFFTSVAYINMPKRRPINQVHFERDTQNISSFTKKTYKWFTHTVEMLSEEDVLNSIMVDVAPPLQYPLAYIHNPNGIKIRKYDFRYRFTKNCSDGDFDRPFNKRISLFRGGIWTPKHCSPKWRVAILVPYRDRKSNLKRFLSRIHGLMQFQQLNYGVYVIEQNDSWPFNRGKLLNIGYLLSLLTHPYNCLVLHDVDKLPDSINIRYDCEDSPLLLMTLSRKENSAQWKNAKVYERYFGGVVSIMTTDYRGVNGMVNHYWGWGGEDDDFYNRLEIYGIKRADVTRPQNRYLILSHRNSGEYSYRTWPKKRMSMSQIRTSGLSNIKFDLINVLYENLYTFIQVRV